jgi:N-methylhydantoinase A
MGMTQAIVPVHAGVLSALGMLAAPRARHLSRTINAELAHMDIQELEAQFKRLEQSASDALRQEGVAAEDIQRLRSVDLRYRGQSYALNVPWQDKDRSADAFHQLHEQRYGHQLAQPLELVTARVKLTGIQPQIQLTQADTTNTDSELAAMETVSLPGITEPVGIFPRDSLSQDQIILGPALITETVSSTFLATHWECHLDPNGNLILEKNNHSGLQ